MQIKTTVRSQFTLFRMAIIKKSINNKYWRGCGEKGTLLHCWWECKLIQPLWRTIWSFLKKLKRKLPYDPTTPLLGTYLEEIMIQKDTCTPMFTAVLFTIARTWKWSKSPSVDERIKKMEYYSARKENETFLFAATWVDLEILILSKVRQWKTNVI